MATYVREPVAQVPVLLAQGRRSGLREKERVGHGSGGEGRRLLGSGARLLEKGGRGGGGLARADD
jgi:hypothetical protein